MSYCYRVFGLLAALAVVPALAEAQSKTSKVDEASLRAKLVAGPHIDGKFTKLDVAGDDKSAELTFTYENKKVKQAGYKKFIDAATRYNAALDRRSTSLEEIRKLKADAEAAQKDAYEIEEIAVKFALKPTDKAVVRTMNLPTDDNGKPKVLKPSEMQKLKGDPKLPGYIAKWTDLNKDDTVRIYLDKTRIKKGEEIATYPVGMIVIQAPPPAPPKASDDDFKPIPLR